MILISNYLKNKQAPLAIPIASQTVEVANRLTNSGGIDKVYLIDSSPGLRQALKISTIIGFDPAAQVLLGVVTAAKPNAGYGIALEATTVRDNSVNIDYRVVPPEEGKMYAEVISYPKIFLAINRVDLPVFSPLNFVFTNLTEGATQTITWAGGTI